MDELVKLVSQKSGISEDQARTAANAVIRFLEERLPEPVAGQIGQFLGQASAGGPGGLGGLAQGLGGVFGGKK